jgi:hypothetical protein
VASRHGAEADYEQPSKHSFVVYLTAKKLVYLIFVGFEKTLSGFGQQLPANCSVFLFLSGAEYYQSLEIALTNVE